jgi:hypothetical protein
LALWKPMARMMGRRALSSNSPHPVNRNERAGKGRFGCFILLEAATYTPYIITCTRVR